MRHLIVAAYDHYLIRRTPARGRPLWCPSARGRLLRSPYTATIHGPPPLPAWRADPGDLESAGWLLSTSPRPTCAGGAAIAGRFLLHGLAAACCHCTSGKLICAQGSIARELGTDPDPLEALRSSSTKEEQHSARPKTGLPAHRAVEARPSNNPGSQQPHPQAVQRQADQFDAV